MRFLTGPEIQAEVRRITARTGEVMAAVAYWGTEAAERTGLTHVRDAANVRIICDLLSGACNPDEIESLMNLGVCVRTLDRLEVWINGEGHSRVPMREEWTCRQVSTNVVQA